MEITSKSNSFIELAKQVTNCCKADSLWTTKGRWREAQNKYLRRLGWI